MCVFVYVCVCACVCVSEGRRDGRRKEEVGIVMSEVSSDLHVTRSSQSQSLRVSNTGTKHIYIKKTFSFHEAHWKCELVGGL